MKTRKQTKADYIGRLEKALEYYRTDKKFDRALSHRFYTDNFHIGNLGEGVFEKTFDSDLDASQCYDIIVEYWHKLEAKRNAKNAYKEFMNIYEKYRDAWKDVLDVEIIISELQR